MAAAFYPIGLKAILDAFIAAGGTLKCALIDTGAYTYSSAHDFYNDVSAGVVGTPGALASVTTTGGVLDAADLVFTAVSGSSIEAVIIYNDTGVAGTSPVIAYIDGLTLTPNGGNITAQWNASGICAIGS